MIDDWKSETVESCLQPISLPRIKLQTSAYKPSGKYPIIDQSQLDIAGWTDDDDGVICDRLPVIVFGDHSRTLKYVDVPFVRGADGTQILKPRSDIDPRFFYYALHSLNLESRGYNRHFTLLKEKLIPVPERPEQVRIAQVLKHLEDGIHLQERQAAAIDELKSVARHELFARGLHGVSQKETKIGPVPVDWKVGPIGDFAQFQRGFDITKDDQVGTGSVPVVSSGGVKSFHNVAASQGPGVIIGRKGSIGSVHYIAADYWPHDTTLWCKDFRGNVPKFVYYRMQLVDMKRLDSGATNPALNRNFLHSELISWPDMKQQAAIVEVIEAIERKIELHRTKLQLLKELFEQLLHGLMTRGITVDDLVVPPGSLPEGCAG